jgi:CpXC protein
MSTFAAAQVPCPHCARIDERSIALTVNATRTPAYRAAVLDGTFQRFVCAGCAAPFVVEEPFLYLELGRKLLIACAPVDEEAHWPRYERMALERFEEDLGSGAPAVARQLGEGVRLRAVFGLAALREKLVCFEAGLDDAVLEAFKLELCRSGAGLPLHPEARLRLESVSAGELSFAMPERGHGGDGSDAGDASQAVVVDRAAFARFVVAPGWEALVSRLGSGPYVDLGRVLLPASGELAGVRWPDTP